MAAKLQPVEKYDFNAKQKCLIHEIARNSVDNMKKSGCVTVNNEEVFITHQMRLVEQILGAFKPKKE